MLLCLIQASCGLALAAAPQFVRVEAADRILTARALDDGAVALLLERRALDGDLAERRLWRMRPRLALDARADLRVVDGAIVVTWRRTGGPAAPSRMGEQLVAQFEGDALLLQRRARLDPIGAGQGPRRLEDRATAATLTSKDQRAAVGAIGAGEHPGSIVCPAGLGAAQAVAADRSAVAEVTARAPGRQVHPPGLPD